jgi:hypothetical protein
VPLETDIYQALTAQTAAGDRVYPITAIQGAAMPRVTYQRISTAPSNGLNGNAGLDQVRVQVDCWAKTMPAVSSLAAEVRAIMEAAGFKALLQATFDDYEIDTQIFRRSLDFRCWEKV